MTEYWKDIIGYEGLYQVSNKGRVSSMERRVRHPKGGTRAVQGRILKLCEDTDGYPQIMLHKADNGKTFKVHFLVLEAFVGPRPDGSIARHFPDSNPKNNNIDNLSWATPKKNQEDRIVHGTHCRGENNVTSKLREDDVREILKMEGTQQSIANKFGIGQAHVSNIKLGKAWRHIVSVIVVAFISVISEYSYAGDPGYWGSYSNEIRSWFPTVMQPGFEEMHDQSHSCCGVADAYEVRTTGEDPVTGDIIVVIDDGKGLVADGTVVHAPRAKIQTKYGNPFPDKLILFMSTNRVVFCLIPNSGM